MRDTSDPEHDVRRVDCGYAGSSMTGDCGAGAGPRTDVDEMVAVAEVDEITCQRRGVVATFEKAQCGDETGNPGEAGVVGMVVGDSKIGHGFYLDS